MTQKGIETRIAIVKYAAIISIFFGIITFGGCANYAVKCKEYFYMIIGVLTLLDLILLCILAASATEKVLTDMSCWMVYNHKENCSFAEYVKERKEL